MAIIDLILRVAGITLLLMQAGMLTRYARHNRTAQFGIALALSLACVMATSTVDGYIIPKSALFALTPISMSSAVILWWFAQSLFLDDFRLNRWQIGIAAIWVILGAINLIEVVNKEPITFQLPSMVREAMSYGFIAHILYLALGERKNDLVERRRKIRTQFALAIMAVFFIDLIAERVFGFQAIPIWSSALQNAFYLAVTVWSVIWLNRIDVHELTFEKPTIAKRDPSTSEMSPRESALKAKLDAMMEEEQIFLDQTLSISSLAEKLSSQEHQVRLLINKSMGHRNFRSYLNQYRLAAAKAALSDEKLVAIPVLTIAMDSGFASLSSFNRAFKLETGQTPTAFRDQALKSAPQN